MKKLVLTTLLSIMFYSVFATAYIYNPGGTGVVSVVGNWWTGAAGTGTQLTAGIGFTTANNTFEIRNSVTILSANWTVSGSNSKVIVGNTGVAGITFTIPSGFTFTGTIDIVNASSGTNTLDIINTSIPTLGSLSNGSTVSYSAAAAQTVAVKTYQNLTLAGSGAKTLSSVTVNGRLSRQGTATASVAPTYGSAATLEYNSTSNLTVGPEWIATFIATGGVSITNTRVVTLNAAKQIGNNTSVPLQIASGATLNTSVSNFTLTLHGDLINSGTLTGNTSPVIIGGTTAAQTIGGFTTTGLVSMTKTSGAATMAGNLPQTGTGSFPLTINGSGGTIIFGGTSTFTTTGTLTVQNGSLRLNNVILTSPTTHSHQAGNFTMTSGTVDFSDQNTVDNLAVKLNIGGHFTKSGGILQSSNPSTSGSFGGIYFNGTAQNINNTTAGTSNTEVNFLVVSPSVSTPISDFSINPGTETFEVETGGTLVFGASRLITSAAGGGTFKLNAGGTVRTANLAGINSTGATGSVQTTTRTFSSLANLVYNGTSPQNTGVFVTSPTALTVNNLSISNTPMTTGMVTAQQDFTVNGVFAADNGLFDIGGTAGTPQTLTLNGTITNAEDNYNRLRANGNSNVTIGNTGTGGSGPLGHQLFFDQEGKGKSKGTLGADDMTVLTPGTTNNVKNFTMNRPGQTVVLQKEMQVNNVVNITAGTLASGGSGSGNSTNLVMLSTETSTSSVLELVSGAAITGRVVVQSYFKGGTVVSNRGFRMISSPIVEPVAPNQFFQQIKYRFIVTGQGAATNGFDVNPNQAPNAPTITRYVETGAIGVTSFSTIPNITTASIPGQGYYFFFRGNRSNLNSPAAGKINVPFSAPENWTAAYIGVINSGNVGIAVTKTVVDVYDGINLVGNPYPGTLDFQTFRDDADNVGILDDYISILNRDRTGFVTQSGRVTNGVVQATLGTGSTDAGLGIIRYVQPGQGFFIRKAATGSSSITFKESHKADITNSPNAKRLLTVKGYSIKSEPRKLIRISIEDGVNRDDATVVLESGNDASYGGNDAPYFSNASVACYTLTSDEKPACINFMPSVEEVDSLRIFVTSGKSLTSATLNFTDIRGAGYKDVNLVDNHLGVVTKLKKGSNSYAFVMDKSLPTSFGKGRFVLRLEKPINNLVDFKAKVEGDEVELKWETMNEVGIEKNFEIERSVDGKKFEVIGMGAVIGNSDGVNKYARTDAVSSTGTVYYRLKVNAANGTHRYSGVETVNFGIRDSVSIAVYPNPVIDELNVTWKKANRVDIVIYDISGRVVRSIGNGEGKNCRINVTGLNKGTYVLRLKGDNGEMGASKFTKL